MGGSVELDAGAGRTVFALALPVTSEKDISRENELDLTPYPAKVTMCGQDSLLP
jgi:hypothetical protein